MTATRRSFLNAEDAENLRGVLAERDQLRAAATASSGLRALLADRLGVAPNADVSAITEALDSALSRRRSDAPDGTELVDVATLADLRADAERGRTAHHDQLLASAIRDGRIPPASRGSWATLLAADPNAETTLASLRRGTVPLSSLGYSDDHESRELLDLWADERT